MRSISVCQRVALLIDADNVHVPHYEHILKIAASYGNLTINCAYGDWGKKPLSPVCGRVDKLNINRVQVNRTGIGATDKQLISDAGKILDEGDVDTFIIVSGDGDFSPLCNRIKQKGLKVIGIGNKGQTSSHLQTSCDKFYFVNDLEKVLAQRESLPHKPETLVTDALSSMPRDNEGWVDLSRLGTKLRELDKEFEKRPGAKKLSKWLSSLSIPFDISGTKVRQIQ